MRSSTERSDWFADALAEQPGVLVSGSLKSSSAYLGDAGRLSIRVLGHIDPASAPRSDLTQHLKVRAFVAVELNATDALAAWSPPGTVRRLADNLARIFRVPFSVVAFASNRSGELDGMWVDDPVAGVSGTTTPGEYASALHASLGIRDGFTTNPKPLNRSINDSFQVWTRSFLSDRLIFNDIDAIARPSPDATAVLALELKRTAGFGEWGPFLDDAANYALLKGLVRAGPTVVDLTLRYRKELPPCAVELHTVSSVTDDCIAGWCRRLEAETPEELVRAVLAAADLSIDAAYSSSRRRAR